MKIQPEIRFIFKFVRMEEKRQKKGLNNNNDNADNDTYSKIQIKFDDDKSSERCT